MSLEEPKERLADDLYLDQILNDMQNGVLAVDSHGTVLYTNPQMNSFLEEKNVKGRTLFSLMENNENPENDEFWNCIVDVIFKHAIHRQTKVRYTAPSGRDYRFHVTSSYLSLGNEADDRSNGVVLTVADETIHEVLEKKKHDSMIVLIGILVLVCSTVFVSSLYNFLDGAFPRGWIARFTEISGFALMLLFLKYTSLTVHDFGLVSKKRKSEIIESLIIVTVMIFVMAVAKMIMIRLGSHLFPSNRPFFDFTAPPNYYYVTYIFIVFMQEFLTRCGLQKSLNKILENKHKNLVSVLVTSVMFMAVHLQHGLVYMIGAGLLNAVLAIVYNRHNGILGTCIIHYAFGVGGLILQWIK